MKRILGLVIVFSFAIAEEKDNVWSTVVSTWEDDLAGKEWISKHCVDEVLAWSLDNPMPMNKTSLLRDRKHSSKNSQMVYYDVQLAGIVIKGNTAIVHYYFKNEIKDNEGKVKKDNGRLTDILTKEKGKWKYLAWSESKPNNNSK